MRATVRITGIPDTQAKLRALRPALKRNLVAEIKRQAFALQALVVEKLSGVVLRVRTGTLRRSITTQVRDTGTGVEALVGTNVEYARIHEFGGTIHIPEITPVTAKALRFEMAGATVFAARTQAHDVHIPERSYLRSSLRDRQAAILAGIRAAIVTSLREAFGK